MKGAFGTTRPEPERDHAGNPYLTEKFIMDMTTYKGFPSHVNFITTIELDILGFKKMRYLDTFVNVEVLNLCRNKIEVIEGISTMKQLKVL